MTKSLAPLGEYRRKHPKEGHKHFLRVKRALEALLKLRGSYLRKEHAAFVELSHSISGMRTAVLNAGFSPEAVAPESSTMQQVLRDHEFDPFLQSLKEYLGSQEIQIGSTSVPREYWEK
jgi:hypothetical protein